MVKLTKTSPSVAEKTEKNFFSLPNSPPGRPLQKLGTSKRSRKGGGFFGTKILKKRVKSRMVGCHGIIYIFKNAAYFQKLKIK